VASERALLRPLIPELRASFAAGRWSSTALDLARMLVQVAVLVGFSAGGTALQGFFHLPVPGNVIGLVVLFAALACGAIKLEWLELGGGFLTKHLAFFFVPVTVGVMGFGATFARAGVGIVVALLVSAIVGLVVAGVTTERLSRRR
jgi:holin-like protein